MVSNFVTDSDLESYWPDISTYRRGAQVDFSDTIARAHEIVVRDIQNKGYNPRLMMVPLDLNRGEATDPNYQHLLSSSVSANTNGYAHEGKGREGRFVVTVSSRTASTAWRFELQGSNESERPEDDSAYWTTFKTVNIDTAGEGETNYTFVTLYRWYRVVVTLVTGPGTIAFTAGLYETVYDALICHKALELAFAQWTTRLSNQWEFRYEKARADYEAALSSMQFSYDSDEDGIPDSTQTKMGGTFGSMPSIA